MLVAGGLTRRAGRRELERLLRPERARAFRGRILVHDCEADDLRPIDVEGRATRIHAALLDTDLVVTVGAGETVLHGGANALLGACAAGSIRAARAVSLLEPAGASGWRLAAALESEVRRSTPVVGLSLVLDRPRVDRPVPGLPVAGGVPRRRGPLSVQADAERRARSASTAGRCRDVA